MKMPRRPPSPELVSNELADGRFIEVIKRVSGPLVGSKYLHWDDLYYRTAPDSLTLKEWWFGLKLRRNSVYERLPLKDKGGDPFSYASVAPIPEQLHEIDVGLGGQMLMSEPILNAEERTQYYVNSLIEEAITSSQLEGAATTRDVAREMIKSGRSPRDKSERMILNNYLTMRRIGELRTEPLTKEIVFEIHRLVTDRTLEQSSAGGRFRNADEVRVVGDDFGEVFHVPPPSQELDQRLEAMCAFANGQTPSSFLHPVIRSIALHFWLAYDHPFVDGNGRTARALFYWSMLRHRYWLCEYISISHIIRKAPVQYARAFLLTETDENDLTYFLIYHLGVIRLATQELHNYIKRKTILIRALESRLQGLEVLNYRQQALIAHALRHPNRIYTVESHRVSHNVVYQTARTDLLDLESRGLLVRRKTGKALRFGAVRDLEERLQNGACETISEVKNSEAENPEQPKLL